MRVYSNEIKTKEDDKSNVHFWLTVANTVMLTGLVLVHVVMYIAHHAA